MQALSFQLGAPEKPVKAEFRNGTVPNTVPTPCSYWLLPTIERLIQEVENKRL